MNGINEYLTAIITASALGVLADLVTSALSEKHPDIEKVTKLGITLCMMAVIILPIIGKSGVSDSFKAYNPNTDIDSMAEADKAYLLEREAEAEASEYIFEKTGIKPVSVRINIEMKDEKNIRISEAEIKMSRDYYEADEKIRQAAAEALGTEVQVTYAD